MLSDFLYLMSSELIISLIIILLLFIKVGKGISNESLLLVVQVLILLLLTAGILMPKDGTLFSGMYQTNHLISIQKNILLVGVLLISMLFTDWFKQHEHLAEFFILMFSALLGMFFLVSSGNLLLFFLSLELATIPVAALANFDLNKKTSAEGAMKMILSSAFSSGILLFGISLIYGTTGTLSFAELHGRLTGDTLQILAFVFFFTAFAFKLSVVPFHLWTADVYEGSPMPVTSFLSVISKGAVAFILMNLLYTAFRDMQPVWHWMLIILSVITMVTGNLFALRQFNIKRFLAFSSIAQVGFILVGMLGLNQLGGASVTFFVLVYIFSNLAAFGVAGIISARTGRESIRDYNGLYQTNPFLSWMMALALFSLAGIPPMAGFFGKLFLITSGASQAPLWFIVIAALNMIVSLFYYLRVVRAMFMENNARPVPAIQLHPSVKLALWICGAGMVLLGVVSYFYDRIAAAI